MKVLVTGPSGAVGQYILEMLMTTNHDVRVLALPDSMHRINFRDRIDMVLGELADPIAMAEAVDGIDIVYHAALVSPPPQITPEVMMEVNAHGTKALVDACAGRVKRLVLCSSNNVYRPHRMPSMWPVPDDAPRESHGVPQQVALGDSLIAAEDHVFEAGEAGRLEYSVLRPTQIAGRKSPFVDTIIRGIFNNPGQIETQRRMWDTMQWCHGTDIARAALQVAEDERARNECFLVCGEEPITVYDVQSLIWEIMNVGNPDNPYADIASRNNIGLCKFEPRKLKALGWRSLVGVKQCIGEVLGRLDFFTAASSNLPAHLMDE